MLFSRRRLFHRIGFRLACWHSLLFMVMALLLLGGAYTQLRDFSLARDLETVDLRLSFYVSEYERIGLEAVKKLADSRRSAGQRSFFLRIADSNNRTIYVRDPDKWQEFHTADLEKAGAPSGSTTSHLSIPAGDVSLEILGRRLPDSKIMQMGRSTVSGQLLLHRFLQFAVVAIAVALFAGFATGTWMTQRALAPVRRLTSDVQAIAGTGNFAARVASPGIDEDIDKLIEWCNAMLGRVETLAQSLRESLDNVAHDLRTPLTRLHNAAETALRSPTENAGLVDALATCAEESEQVLTILRGLMDIAEAKSGIAAFTHQPVDIPALLRDIEELYREVAEDRRVSIRVSGPEGMIALGDPTALRRVAANLVDNAIKYSEAGGTVMLDVALVDHRVVVTVSDTGAGIPGDELPHIWKELFRGRRARSLPGAGLGLGIVKAIVEAHGGSIEARSEPGLGSVFSVTLPSA